MTGRRSKTGWIRNQTVPRIRLAANFYKRCLRSCPPTESPTRRPIHPLPLTSLSMAEKQITSVDLLIDQFAVLGVSKDILTMPNWKLEQTLNTAWAEKSMFVPPSSAGSTSLTSLSTALPYRHKLNTRGPAMGPEEQAKHSQLVRAHHILFCRQLREYWLEHRDTASYQDQTRTAADHFISLHQNTPANELGRRGSV